MFRFFVSHIEVMIDWMNDFSCYDLYFSIWMSFFHITAKIMCLILANIFFQPRCPVLFANQEIRESVICHVFPLEMHHFFQKSTC